MDATYHIADPTDILTALCGVSITQTRLGGYALEAYLEGRAVPGNAWCPGCAQAAEAQRTN